MTSPRAILEDTDWDGLYHAYEAASDTPQRLVGLLSEDPDLCGEVLGFLDAAVLHQGTIYPVTAPVALFVAGILADPRTLVSCESALPWDNRNRPLRAALLEWLGSVAESAAYDEGSTDEDEDEYEGGDDEYEGEGEYEDDEEAAVEACRAIRRELYLAIAPFLDDADESVREAATGAVTHLLVAPELAGFRAEQADRLQRLAPGLPPLARAGVALTLGHWGVAPRALLADEHPAVRACAALSPALDGEPAALAEIKQALRDPRAADSWFPEPPPQLGGQFRFALVAALLRRTTTFSEVLDSALAIARMTNAYTVDADWGPLLVRAFPDGYSPDRELTTAQRQFLTAVADNDECWGSIANPMLWFHRVGLPSERDELRGVLGQ